MCSSPMTGGRISVRRNVAARVPRRFPRDEMIDDEDRQLRLLRTTLRAAGRASDHDVRFHGRHRVSVQGASGFSLYSTRQSLSDLGFAISVVCRNAVAISSLNQ